MVCTVGALAVVLVVISTPLPAQVVATLPGDSSFPVIVEDAALATEVNSLFGLTASTLVSLDVPLVPDENIEVAVPIEGETVTIFASRHSILTAACRVYVQIEDGSLIESAPEPVRTIRGVVGEYSGSAVAGSVLDAGLSAAMRLPDGRRYWIEPVSSKIPLAERSLHVLYRAEDVIASGGSCASDAAAPAGGEGDGAPRGAACGTGLCFAEMATDADFEYFSDWGTTTAVQNRIQLVINTMNLEYEDDVDITHVISSMVIRTSDASDPYTATNSDTLVSQFRTHWNTNFPSVPRDIAQLFTGKEIDGDTIGQAFNIGVVCTNQAYSYSQSDCCGSLACTTDLHAHENGHVWGGFHCNPCSGTTMHTPLQCANTFGGTSISQISAHRDSRSCLTTSGTLIPPFADDFPTTTLDSTKWSIIDGATANTLATNEPSAPNSLNIDENDSITSVAINLSVSNDPTFSYFWQRTGGGDSPENNEDLIVEYLNNVNTWIQLAAHPGAGSDTDPFQFASHLIPADGRHGFFRVRFRGISTSTTGQDDFFVDNINLDPGDIAPPSPSPMQFASLPAPNPSNPTSEVTMEAVTATDVTGPVEYFFERTNGTPANSGWISSTTWVGPGPVANSPWSFRVKARDAAPTANETSFSVPSATITAIETPSGIASSNILGDRFDLTAQGTFTSLSSQQSGLFFEVKDGQGNPAGVGANEWTQSSISPTRTITGLLPMTEYTVRVKARNRSAVETAFTSSIQVTTGDLIVPGAPGLSNPTDVTMTLTINTNGNLPSTEYAIQCSASAPLDPTWDGQYVTHASGLPSASPDWQPAGAPRLVTGLTPGTSYTFHVKARNVALAETAFGPTANLSTVTLQTPGAPVLSNPATTTIELEINTAGNPANMQYAIQCIATLPGDSAWQGNFVQHAGGAPNGPTEDWQVAGSPIQVTSLKPNVRYTFAVKARNSTATFETPLGPSSAQTTLALVPGQPIAGAFPLYSTTIDVTPDGDAVLENASDTEFAIRCVSTNPPDSTWNGNYVAFSGSASSFEVWLPDLTWGEALVQGLSTQTEYEFAVKARNRDGVETAFGPSIVLTTGTDCNSNSISDAQELVECTGSPACDDCNNNGTLDGCEVGFEAAQWASAVIDFSAEYEPFDPTYNAVQVLGPPNVAFYGDSPLAWSPEEADLGLEFVTVGFDHDVYATGVVVRENLSNGYVVKIEAVRLDDTLTEVWPLATGETDTSLPGDLADFTATWAETPYLVKGLRVTIDTTITPGDFEEIDAIQLFGRVPSTTPDTNENGVPDSCEAVQTPPSPILSAPTQTGMEITLAIDPNPPTTEYAIQCTASNPLDASWDGQFVSAAGTPSAGEIWQTRAVWGTTVLSIMTPGTEYSFAVKARVAVGVESPLGPSANLSTLPLVTGACCQGDGTCSVITETACDESGGNYQGDDTACEPNPCPQPCVTPGDMNVDGSIDGIDIAGYMRARLGQPPEPGENQACADFGTGDLEQDTALFVAALIGE